MNIERERLFLDALRIGVGSPPVLSMAEWATEVFGGESYEALRLSQWSKEFE